MKQFYIKQNALGSVIEISLFSSKSQAQINHLNQILWKKIYSFEKSFSRFIFESELSRFNRSAGLKFIISDDFRNILIKAKKLSILSDELYNPFILPALQRVGYLKSQVKGFESDPVDDYRDRNVLSINKLEIGEDWARIPYGGALDLGGIGKGYLADQLGNYLKHKVEGFWLSIGGDIVLKAPNKDFKIEIASGLDQDKVIGYFNPNFKGLDNIASSGPNQRKGRKLLRNWHHLIDPRTLKPVNNDVQLVSVSSISCLNSDVLASVLCIDPEYAINKLLKAFKINDVLIQALKGPSLKFSQIGQKIKLSENITKSNIINLDI